MSLIPLDKSGDASLYNNNQHITKYNPDILDINYSSKREFPIDPKNDLLPPAYASPMSDMNMGPPEQSIQRYFSLTINDINHYQKEKIKKQIKIYEKILGNCYRRVREYVMKDQKYTFYTIPEYMTGFPLYDLKKCSYFLVKKLNENGFRTKFIQQNVIYINWGYPIKNENMKDNMRNNTENNMRDNTGNNMRDNMGNNRMRKQKEDVHYIRLNPERQNQSVNFNQERPSEPEPVLNKYTMQREEQFLFS